MPEFREFPKIPRLNRECIVTEKIDGTNGCVIVNDEGVFAQSRNNVLTADSDPFGFGLWVRDNADALREALGPGYHFGEWWGRKIQRTYGLDERRFSLFNVGRWEGVELPAGVFVVPVLARGIFSTSLVQQCVDDLRANGSRAVPGFMRPEGVVVWHSAAEHSFKVTLERDEEWKGKRHA